MSAHARLSASSAERWIHCPGSVDLAATLPPGSTPYAAAEGTFAHDIAAICLTHDTHAASYIGKKDVVDGHEFVCDADMAEHIQTYVDHCNQNALPQRWVELSVTPALQQWDNDLGGTADFVTYDPARKLLRVMDFKFGAGMFVSADDNKQLKVYALGALLAINLPTETVEVHIIQPRYEGALPIRVESFPAIDLLDFAGELAEAAKRTRAKDSATLHLMPGPWCKKTFCPNARICPALANMQQALVVQEFKNVVAYDAGALAKALQDAPLVEERIAALRSFAYERAVAGDNIPGFKLVEKRARRHWTDENAVIQWAKKRAIEPFENPELKSPAQLEKGLKKAEKEELKAWTVSVSSGVSLVPESDARPPVSKQITVDDFEAIGGPEAPKQLTADTLFS